MKIERLPAIIVFPFVLIVGILFVAMYFVLIIISMFVWGDWKVALGRFLDDHV